MVSKKREDALAERAPGEAGGEVGGIIVPMRSIGPAAVRASTVGLREDAPPGSKKAQSFGAWRPAESRVRTAGDPSGKRFDCGCGSGVERRRRFAGGPR